MRAFPFTRNRFSNGETFLSSFCFHMKPLLVVIAISLSWPSAALSVLAQTSQSRGALTKIPSASLISRAKGLIEKNEFPVAIRYLTEAVKQSPRSVEVYLLRGEAFDKMGFPMKALQDLNKYVELRPHDPQGFIQRADINNFNLDHKAAIEDYNRALRLVPNSRSAILGRGMAYVGLERYDLAIQDYESVLRRYPNDHESWANLGMAYSLSGRKDKAIESLRKAIELEKNPEWRNKLNHMLEQLLEAPKAERQKSGGPTRFPNNKARGLW
ncbi:MAG: tetratricopeptide repeat protein [Desulfomonilaceae bacterium]